MKLNSFPNSMPFTPNVRESRSSEENSPQVEATLKNSMTSNPYQQVERKSRRRLPSLSLLAVPLIAVILPAIAPAPFAAKAELLPWNWAPCPPPNQTQYCQTYTPEAARFAAYVDALIERWIVDHGLSKEERATISRFGREDLMADINGYIAANVLHLLEKTPESRTPDEQFVVGMVQEHVRATEWSLYDYAVKDAESFIRDPCGWKPDPEVAAVYGLEYDGAPYCGNRGIGVLFRFHIPGPSSQYLYAAAFKKTYGTFGKPLVAALMKDKAGMHLAATAAATVPGGIAGGIVGKNISKFMGFIFKERYNGWTEAAKNAFKLRYTRFIGGGAFGIVTFMANIGIEAIIAFAEEVKFQEDLNTFKAVRDGLATSADAVAILASDSGIEKAMLLANEYGLNPGTDPLPRYRPGLDRMFLVREGTVTRAMEFLSLKDHADHVWQVEMWGNWFLRRTSFDSAKVESMTPDLEVTDHEGIEWIATRIGADRFRMTQMNAPENARVCPTGNNNLSILRDKSCSIYYSDNINIRLAGGQLVNLNLGVAPRIETSTSFFFPARVQSSFPIQVTGQPTPVLEARLLPPWLRLVNGALVGDPGPLAGKTSVDLSVRTQSGSDHKLVTIYYGEPLQFSSSEVVDVTAAEDLMFTINTSGTPRPRITLTGWMPSMLSFRDNGNGTAALRGRWAGGIAPFCIATPDSTGKLRDCGTRVTASNGAQTLEQNLTFRFISQPIATFVGPTELKFVAGEPGEYVLTTSGARTLVEWKTLYDLRLGPEIMRSLPWLQFREQPDGTARVFGTPPMNGQSSSTTFAACPYAQGSAYANCGVLGNLKITVEAGTRFVSNSYAAIRVGQRTSTPVIVNRLNGTIGFSPYHILTSRFPKGLSLEAVAPQPDGKVTARIIGAPEAGQGGRYEFMLNWTDQLSTIYSPFTLDVLQPATVTGPSTFTFFEGSKAVGEVTTQGYPVNAATVKCGPDCTDMSIRLEWGPRRIDTLTLTDRNPQGIPTGVGVFGGDIPKGSSGIYDAMIVASNGPMAPAARMPIRIVVLPAGDLNGDGQADCADLTALRNAIGKIQPVPGQGFDLTGDMVVDEKDVDALVRAVRGLWACLF